MKRKTPKRLTSPRRSTPSRAFPFLVLIPLCLIFLSLTGAAPQIPPSNASIGSNALPHESLSYQTQAKLADGLWSGVEQGAIANVQQQRADLRSYRSVALDQNALAAILHAAPLEFSEAAAEKRLILTLPDPDGTFARFSIAESPIMAPELAARFPEIKTYTGSGIDDPTATTRFDWTPVGFHAIVLSEKGTILIEPSGLGDVENYIVYFQKDVVGGSGECDVTEQDQQVAIARNPIAKHSQANLAVSSGTTLRTYRLAAAATAEYTQTYGGGTVDGGLAAITTTVNLVDAIYEREVAIRLTLIAGETSIIFTDSATDGYTSNNVGAMFNENQTKLDTVIGPASYDIGHVFDGRLLSGTAFSWQGQAGIGVCVDGSKARGVDIFRSVSPTSVFAYYSAAHEMGHQFGASHTFNATSGTCGAQRSSSTAYEPVNGSTIMAYRFACAPEDLMSTDTYFHNASIEQIVNYTTNSNGNSCAVTSTTGNNPPVIDAGPTYTIPMGTPFILTATGSDPDGDALTFGWEEFDLGTAAPPSTDDGSRPIFRSFLPTSNPSRTFPRLQDVLSGFPTLGESLPVTTRTMNFRVTARDNRTGGGGVNSAATQVNVRADSGPFTVTQPSSSNTWSTGSNQTVTWNVANTNIALVSCANVKITLSTDGGTTFPIILANNTPNDGSETVTIPGTPGSGARVKVEAVGNIFFNISQGFTINGSANAPNLTPSQPAGWSDKIVVSNVTGTTTDSSPLKTTDTLYVDWAVVNSGTADINSTFNEKLYIDGIETVTFVMNPPLNINSYTYIQDYSIGSLSAGTHTVKIVADSGSVISESNESDNEYTKTITISAAQAPIQLLLEQFGSPSSQVAALDSISFLRDPFPVLNGSDLLNLGVDRNTRVILFATNLQLAPGETSSSVKVNLVDSNNQNYPDIDAEDVRPVANFDFTQVIFRLPDNLPAGTVTYTIKLKAPDGRVSNSGTIRIRT